MFWKGVKAPSIYLFCIEGDVKMEKVKINYLIDAGLLLSGLGVMITGIIKLPLFIQLGIHRALGLSLITFIHDWSGVVFVILAIVHFILHLNWFICVTKTFMKKGDEKCKK